MHVVHGNYLSVIGLLIVLPGNQDEERAHGPRHLWRKLPEQITGRKESEPKRGSLARVSNVVKAGGKIGVAYESARSDSDEIR